MDQTSEIACRVATKVLNTCDLGADWQQILIFMGACGCIEQLFNTGR